MCQIWIWQEDSLYCKYFPEWSLFICSFFYIWSYPEHHPHKQRPYGNLQLYSRQWCTSFCKSNIYPWSALWVKLLISFTKHVDYRDFYLVIINDTMLVLEICNLDLLMIKNMLTRRKESDTYLTTVSRHRWSRKIMMKIDK